MALAQMNNKQKAAFYASWLIDLAVEIEEEERILGLTSGRSSFKLDALNNRMEIVKDMYESLAVSARG